MSAKVDIANIAGDQGRSLFANVGCRRRGALAQGDGHGAEVSFGENRPVCLSDQPEFDKSPDDPESQKQPCTKRHLSFSVVERNVASKQRRQSDKFPGGSVAFSHRRRGGGRMGRFHAVERLRERIVLPTRFLLGGNITDPLNLNSLCDDEVNKSMNETTPISSPVPIPVHRMEVKVLVPVNSADPLNLNAADNDNSTKQSSLPGTVFRKRRKRNRRRKLQQEIVCEEQCHSTEQVNLEESLHVEVSNKDEVQPGDDVGTDSSARHKRIIDHIVSPVIPQKTSKWKRRRTVSDSRSETVQVDKLRETPEGVKVDKSFTRNKRRHLSAHTAGPHVPAYFRQKDWKFSHGSYSAKGTVLGEFEDHRLAYFSKEMFSGKDVLDVGCGVGHVSLSVARDFGAHHVVGLDIDQKVVDTALKNKRHAESAMLPEFARFPVAIRRRLGPIVAPRRLSQPSDKFPHNVIFVTVFVQFIFADSHMWPIVCFAQICLSQLRQTSC